MASASELEKILKAKPDSFDLKPNLSGKSDIWNHFFLVYEKQYAADHDQIGDTGDTLLLIEQKYFCVCLASQCRILLSFDLRAEIGDYLSEGVRAVPGFCQVNDVIENAYAWH